MEVGGAVEDAFVAVPEADGLDLAVLDHHVDKEVRVVIFELGDPAEYSEDVGRVFGDCVLGPWGPDVVSGRGEDLHFFS